MPTVGHEANDLLSVDLVVRTILDRMSRLPGEIIFTAEALDRVLAEDVIAKSDIPPFANSSMDGYALRAEDVEAAAPDHPVRLQVIDDISAGSISPHVVGPLQTARIMTGAPLPKGANAVVPVEDTDDQWEAGDDVPLPEQVAIYRRVGHGDHVRQVGEDIQAGQRVLQAGRVLRPQDIGVIVSIGRAQIPVVRQPRVAILSTGDELLDIDEPSQPGKIRNSNSYMLAGLVTTCGGLPFRLPVARDTLDEVRARFADALAFQPDLILSSAGVSVGTRDVVRAVVDELGHIDLWRVNLRPGKPLAFGQVQGVPFFGLPGNPVSASVTFDLFVRPALLALGGRPDRIPIVEAVIDHDIESDGRRSYLRVRLIETNGQWTAHLTGTQSSGALLSMVLADGLLIVPEGMRHVPAGTRLSVRLLG